MPGFPTHIFGLHDPGGEKLMLDAGKPGWIVVTACAADGGGDYSALANAGLQVIVRLNNGYGSDGTLPPSSQYDRFARDCAAFVSNSKGASIWIIGNETNVAWERPGNQSGDGGEVITPDKYALCFAVCRAAILALPGHGDDWVVPAPPGPWNPQTTYQANPSGDWVQYFRDLLDQCLKLNAVPGALALHTYTHGCDPNTLSSDQMVGGSFPNLHWNFRAYRDFLAVVPDALRSLPVLITETQPADPDWWRDLNNGWVRAAYSEIAEWNSHPENQPVQALCLFRWQTGEPRWSVSDKHGVIDDLRGALQNDYRVRRPAALPPRPAPDRPTKPAETGWCPFASRRPITTENYYFGRDGHAVTAAVMHIAAGPLRAVFPTFNNPNRQASAHFCVGKDGTIEQYLSIDDTAFGAGLHFRDGAWYNPRGILCRPTWPGLQAPDNPNLYTISIEHEGQPQDAWTPQMYKANNRLLQWIAGQVLITYYPHQTLIGHYEIDPVDRPNCPGPNVDWNAIAADANAGSSGEKLAAIQAASLEVDWLPINTGAALFQYARAQDLGCPQSNEFGFKVGSDAHVGQVYTLGIVYVMVGDWTNIGWVKKVGSAEGTSDMREAAALRAAQKQLWMPVNTDAALYKFAQANQLGCPQTDEFEFNVGEDYLGQVFVNGFVFAPRASLDMIRWVPKPSR